MIINSNIRQITLEEDVKDDLALSIVTHIGDNLNWIFAPINKLAVKSVKTYDAYSIPSTSYPLLSCYRVQDNYYANSELALVNFNMKYVIQLPEQDFAVSLASFIAKSVNSMIVGLYESIQIKAYEETLVNVVYNTPAIDSENVTFVPLLTFNFTVYGT